MADDNYTEPLSHERRRYDEALAAQQRPDPDAVAAEEATRLRHLALWNEAMDRWVLFETGPEADQRRQEAEDLRFDRARLEDHWPEDQRVARGASTITSGGVQINVSARPMLVISKLAQPVAQIVNEGLRARLAPTVKAKPGKANDEDAEVAQGLLRALEQNGNAAPARGWGWTRAVKCGRGYWRVETVFANDGDFELDIVTGRIKNQGSVYIDLTASGASTVYDIETLPSVVPLGNEDRKLEGNIAEAVVSALLLDLSDDLNEPRDTISLRDQSAWYVFRYPMRDAKSDRGGSGADLVDFLDGWICADFGDLGASDDEGLRGNALGLHDLAYDFAPVCP